QAERLRPDVAPSEFRARVSLPPSLRPSRPEGETGADAKKPDAPGNNAEHAKSADGSRADAEGGKPGESLVTTDDQWETVGVHDQLRELLNEIAPPQRDPRLRLRHVNHLALRNAGLPRNPA